MADDDIERTIDALIPTLRILVTGSRSWTDRAVILQALDLAAVEAGVPPGRVTVVHGAARGADRLADSAARELGMRTEAHPADWSRHGKRAGFLRNAEMVKLGADLCLAFALSWDSGTGHCARLARSAGIDTTDYGVGTRATRPVPGLLTEAAQPDLFGEVRHVG